ncbi:hypothetical protein DFH27DRAFT_644499 [Peziza echinospora]|nr:hypothetical protein DFH27DRAFT_644499 [Peziza echinospora]
MPPLSLRNPQYRESNVQNQQRRKRLKTPPELGTTRSTAATILISPVVHIASSADTPPPGSNYSTPPVIREQGADILQTSFTEASRDPISPQQHPLHQSISIVKDFDYCLQLPCYPSFPDSPNSSVAVAAQSIGRQRRIEWKVSKSVLAHASAVICPIVLGPKYEGSSRGTLDGTHLIHDKTHIAKRLKITTERIIGLNLKSSRPDCLLLPLMQLLVPLEGSPPSLKTAIAALFRKIEKGNEATRTLMPELEDKTIFSY